MVTHTRPSGPSRPLVLCTSFALALVVAFSAACDKVPLTAPSGSVITLFATATSVPVNGQVEIVATVIENGVATTSSSGSGTGGTGGTGGTSGTTSTTRAGAGTPVQNGTLVSFTTNLGRVEPREARTHNGEVRVTFYPDGQSGLATITAYSGGASGKLENLKVGAAAIERLIVSASPQTLGPSGGTSVITARAEDSAGLGLAGVPVTFTSDAGSVSPTTAITNAQGVATATLTTNAKAKVTASASGKTADVNVGLNPRTGVSIAGPANSVTAGTPAAFTVGVSNSANIRNVVIDFGDGSQQSLGAISGSTTITHTYAAEGTYVARAIATDTSNFSEEVTTAVTILPGQAPGVTCAPSNANPSVNELVVVNASVTGATSTIVRYDWNFGADSVPANAQTTGNRVTASWTATGTKIITVRAVQATGPAGEGICAVVVKP